MSDNGLEILPGHQPERQLLLDRVDELTAADAMIEAAFADMALQLDPSDPVKTHIENHLNDHFAHGPRGNTGDN